MKNEITYHRLNPDNARLLIGSDIFDKPVGPKRLTDFINHPARYMKNCWQRDKQKTLLVMIGTGRWVIDFGQWRQSIANN